MSLDGFTLLDAGMGTALQRQGLPAEAFPEEWILSRPASIAAIHASHARAGARILLTCTFNATPNRLRQRGLSAKLEGLCGWAERLARAAGRGLLVAGAVGPSGLAGPGSRATRSELREQFAEPFRALAAAGADMLWAETQYDLEEARAALATARRIGLPAVVTMTLVERPSGLTTPCGEEAFACLSALAKEGAAAVGVNCVLPEAPVEPLFSRLADFTSIPLVAKPSAGLPGKTLAPRLFALRALEMSRAGALLVGGCCGTTAAHLRAIGRRA